MNDVIFLKYDVVFKREKNNHVVTREILARELHTALEATHFALIPAIRLVKNEPERLVAGERAGIPSFVYFLKDHNGFVANVVHTSHRTTTTTSAILNSQVYPLPPHHANGKNNNRTYRPRSPENRRNALLSWRRQTLETI